MSSAGREEGVPFVRGPSGTTVLFATQETTREDPGVVRPVSRGQIVGVVSSENV